jgi:hypothetical protein
VPLALVLAVLLAACAATAWRLVVTVRAAAEALTVAVAACADLRAATDGLRPATRELQARRATLAGGDRL